MSERVPSAYDFGRGIVARHNGTEAGRNFMRTMIDVDRQMKSEAEFARQWLIAQGVKLAHPDDGWVDRRRHSIMPCYPLFNCGPKIGDKIALAGRTVAGSTASDLLSGLSGLCSAATSAISSIRTPTTSRFPMPSLPSLDALEKLARAATGGGWMVHAHWKTKIVPADHAMRSLGFSAFEADDKNNYAHPIVEASFDSNGYEHRRREPEARANAAYIAAAHPQTMLALIARIRELEAENKRLSHWINPPVGTGSSS